MGQIYKILNKETNKIYIGQTVNTFKERYAGEDIKSVYRTTTNKHLKKSIKKYGEDCWEIIILHEDVNDIKLLDELEIYYIKKYKSNDVKYGYNKTSGGQKSQWCNIRVICVNTLEVFDSQSVAALKYDLHGSTIGQCCRGERKYCGIHPDNNEKLQWDYFEGWDKEYKLKDIQYEASSWRKVICINTNEIFENVKLAMNKYSIKSTNLYDCLYKNRPTAGIHPITKERLQWDYYEEGKEYNLQEYKLAKKAVICLNTLEIFESGADASKIYGLNKGNLNACCKGTQKTCGIHPITKESLQWSYFEGWDKEYKLKDLRRNTEKEIICLNTLEIYKNVDECSKQLGISKNFIMKVINKRMPSTKNLTFEIYDKSKKYEKIQPIQSRRGNSGSFERRQVVCLDAKEIYVSISEAAKAYNCRPSDIIACCQGKQKTCKGHRWEYYDENTHQDYNQIVNLILDVSHIELKEKYQPQKVICINTQQVYDSMLKASKDTGDSTNKIKRDCVGNSSTTKGLQWSFYEEGKIYALRVPSEEKPIIHVNTGVIYNTLQEVVVATNTQKANVKKCCENSQISTCKQQFQYYEEGKTYELKEYYKPKQVICIDTGVVYKSYKHAADETGIHKRNIQLCCNKVNENHRIAGGYEWSYYEEGKEYVLNYPERYKSVICLDNMTVFDNIMIASKETGTRMHQILNCCEGKKKTRGLHWSYFEEGKQYELFKNKVKKVKCIDTGVVYESANKCAKELNLNASSIRKVCTGKGKTYNNFKWEYVED